MNHRNSLGFRDEVEHTRDLHGRNYTASSWRNKQAVKFFKLATYLKEKFENFQRIEPSWKSFEVVVIWYFIFQLFSIMNL